MRHPRGKKWEPVYEPPEWIQKCLHCEKPECTNCLGYYALGNPGVNAKKRKTLESNLENIVAMAREGKTLKDIATAFGVSKTTLGRMYGKDIQKAKRDQRRKLYCIIGLFLTREKLREKWTISKIAKWYGVPRSIVQQYAKQCEKTKKQR